MSEAKTKMVSVLSDNAATEMQLGDADVGYSANILVAVDHRVFSRKVVSLLNEEMNRALQAMRRHAEACRLPKKGTKR